MINRWLGWILLLLALSSPARAQTADAKKHYQQGEKLYGAGQYAEAIKEFDLAYKLSKRPAILFNIARIYTKMGDEESAIRYLQQYLEADPRAADAASVRDDIAARQKALEEARAKKAEEEAEAARQKTEEAEAEARLAASAARRAAAEAQQAAAERKRARLKVGGIVLIAGGAAVAAGGGVLGYFAERTQRQAEAGAVGSVFDKSIQARGQAFTIAGIVSDVVGGAAVGAGIGILVRTSRKVNKEKPQVWLHPRVGGVALGGTF
ncbi:MAG TPA: tetratricopeptide repeat protein [Polyangia bacterium]|nr:tetratricopeptide repeat protein [Polyangia bacterium]